MMSKFSKFISIILTVTLLTSTYMLSGCGAVKGDARISELVKKMSLDEKISQMIIPAFRTWNEENVTDLSSFPKLSEALRRHQYGGVILFGSNKPQGHLPVNIPDVTENADGSLSYSNTYLYERGFGITDLE